ncbi:Leucine-responsive regulatory protein [Burkholderiales bacterium]|nr:Leucine-responsive regulatory protein [Burkholderiales bacterium]
MSSHAYAPPDLDRTDLRILAILQEIGRMQDADLAPSPAPCLRPIRRLEASGVLLRCAAIVDPRRVGPGLTAHLEVPLDKQGETARITFRKAVPKGPEVQTCLQFSGQRNRSMKVVATVAWSPRICSVRRQPGRRMSATPVLSDACGPRRAGQ